MRRPNIRKLLAAANKHFAPKGVRITFNSAYQEYRVNYIGGKEATASYHTDFEDAEGTARDFVARRATHGEHLTRNPQRKKSARRFTRKANTPKKQRQWKHVYSTERKRGLKKSLAIRAANSVIKRETLQRNPRRRFSIEAVVSKGASGVKFMWWDDTGQRFTATRAQASPYTSEAAARIEAKKLVPRLPKSVILLRTVPA